MATFTIAFDPITGRDDEAIEASYHRASDLGDFVEFKDSEHAVVFAVRSAYVVSIRREDAPESRPVRTVKATSTRIHRAN